MHPKVSIIIPCYNIEKYISKCIDSVINQTYEDFELLLIDDGSTDKTLFLIEEYQQKDHRIRVFSHPNRGVSFTRNYGIENATGEMIMFIDGDDYIKSDYIECHIKSFKKEFWVVSGFINDRNGNVLENNNYKNLKNKNSLNLKKSNLFELFKYHSLSSPCCRLYEKSIIIENQIMFDRNVTYQEDLLFNLQYIEFIKGVILLDYFGYFYVENSNSSSTKYHSNFDYTDLLFGKLFSLVKKENDLEILNEFILNTLLKKIWNINHPKNKSKRAEKLKELRNIFENLYFLKIRNHIVKSKINYLLKMFLLLRSPYLIYYYYKFRKI